MLHKPPVFRRAGFTLIEVILVMVIIVIVSAITIPYYAGSLRGMKLRTAARLVDRMARYARSQAILREETVVFVLDPENMEAYLGTPFAAPVSTNAADGELDQDALVNLGYVEAGDEAETMETGPITRQIERDFPDGLSIREFYKNEIEEDLEFEQLHLIRFYANGQCEWFELELEDGRGSAVKLENDPISGKVFSKFTQ